VTISQVRQAVLDRMSAGSIPCVPKSASVRPFAELTMVRSCFRCGQEFDGPPGKRVCPGCKSQRGRKPLSPVLSLRERQIINLVCKAKLNKEIAYELRITEGTIKVYMNRIFQKVGCTNRTELAVWAVAAQIAMPAPA